MMKSLMRRNALLGIFVLATTVAVVGEAQDDAPQPLETGFDTSPPAIASPATPQFGLPALDESPPSLLQDSAAPISASDQKTTIEVRYVVTRPVTEQVNQGGKVVSVVRYVTEVRSERIAVDTNLDELDLPADGKRAAVLAVTAARHDDLLEKLKAAESDEEKAEAADALKTNYTEHYAIETWWREQKLAELEQRLKEMSAQVQQRQEAEEKYVEAAMTIAQLWADGIALAPPKPGNATDYDNTPTPIENVPTLPGPGPAQGDWAPATFQSPASSGAASPSVPSYSPPSPR